jgi:uncharacterized protein (DUF2236 family)
MKVNEQPVLREGIESLWRSVADHAESPIAGIFGPTSVSWKVNRESAVFLGAGRAALLQLAHPWVATALDEHSNLRTAPLARFHNTFRFLYTMIFGSLQQALAASRHVYALHSRIQGELSEGVAAYARSSRYQANDVSALRWVYATLVDSAVVAYESVLPPLSINERETYYAESKTVAALFGIPPDSLPVDWSAFDAYNRTMWTSDMLGANSVARELAQRILHCGGSRVPVPLWYKGLTTAMMPERFRIEFSLAYGEEEKAAAAKAQKWLPRIYRRLPSILRFAGPYHEARERLDGRRASRLTRASNRLWIGEPLMAFSRPDR